MTRLSSKMILDENQTKDPASIISLTLNYKALSDVSCLSEFKNLERLDLSFNNLSSLNDLKGCVNLKWLSVSENKLHSLQGVETLTNLLVLNASRNKLKSMDQVGSLISLRALILNDNQIPSMCRLDQLKDLNTIVLSRNPIRDIGDSLVKLNSITKLSLSNCQLQTIGSSIGLLLNLKELRLAHNEIKTLPSELAQNLRLQNLDLGNNSITRFSDLKVLSSLRNLKNLNLHGNPVAEKDELAKKMKNLVPSIQIFNGRPIDRSQKIEHSEKTKDHDITNEGTDSKEQKAKRKIPSDNKEISRKRGYNQQYDNPFDKVKINDEERERKHKASTANMEPKKAVSSGNPADAELKKDLKRQKKVELNKDSNRYKKKPAEKLRHERTDGEAQLAESILDGAEKPKQGYGKKKDEADIQDIKSLDAAVVTIPAKKKKASKNLGTNPSSQFLSPEIEVGVGGRSTWDD